MDRPQVSKLLDDLAHLIRRSTRLREQSEFIERERQRIDHEIARAYKVVKDAVTGAKMKEGLDDLDATLSPLNESDSQSGRDDDHHRQAS